MNLNIVGNFFVAPSFSLQDFMKAAVAGSILWRSNKSVGEAFEELLPVMFSPSTEAYFLGPPTLWAINQIFFNVFDIYWKSPKNLT